MNLSKTTLRVVLQHLVLVLLCIALLGVRAQAASIYFNNVYQGAGTGYTTSSSPVSNITLLSGNGFRFTSVNPDAPTFVADAGGNDVRGTLSYVNPSGQVVQISGIISRLNKQNGVPEGFYFVDVVNGKGYLLVLAGSESMYQPGVDVRTSSESTLLSSLNTTVTDQQSEPRLAIANTSAMENAGFMVFTLSVNPAAGGNFSFTPTLVAGSATSGVDFTASMQVNTGGSWQPVTGAVSIPAGVTSFRIQVPLPDDNVVENNETFILNSGPISGGNFLNYQGTFGEATILDNDGNPAPITQGDVVYTYGDPGFRLQPTSPNTTGAYSYSITGPGGVVSQQNGYFTILGVGVTQVVIYQASGSGYGMGSKLITVTVLPATLQVVANNKVKVYDGLPFTGGNGVVYNGLKYGETSAVLSGTLVYGGNAQNAVAAGTYAITPNGLSGANYTITFVSGQLLVQKAPLTITAADEVKTYDGHTYNGGNGVSYAGFVAGETTAVLQGALSYSGTAQGAKNVATYTIAPAGYTAANYAITYVNGRLIIDPAPLTIAALAQSKVYNGLAYGGGHAVSYNGFVAGDNETNALTGTLSYTGSWQGATAAGTYIITPQGQSATNYLITYADGTLFINKANVTATVANRSKNYDGQVYSGGYTLSYAGFVPGENQSVLSGTPVFGGAAQAAVQAGNYAITAGGLSAANYNINYVPGTLAINRAALVVRVNNLAKIYDAQPFGGGNGVSINGFIPGEGQSVLGGTLVYGGAAQGAVQVGSHTLTASGYTAANYTISYVPGVLTINPATLTVTTLGHTKTYDGVAYQGGSGVRYSGFVGGETEAVLGGALLYGGTAQGAKNTGSYTLSAGGLTAVNYAIQYIGGTLSITPAVLRVEALAQTKVYDGQPFGGTPSVRYTGLVAGESAAVLGGTPSYSGSWQAATAVGSYTILPSGLSAANYQVSYVAGTLSIVPAPLIATVDDKQKTYDGRVYSGGFTLSVSGFVAGDTYQSVVTGTPVFSGPAVTALGAGSYAIRASGLSAANYTITYVAGTLAIGKAPLLVSAATAAKTYDAQPFAGGNGVNYTGFAPGEDATVLGGNLVYGGAAQGAIAVGSYALTAGGLSAANYTISYVPGTLAISPATLVARLTPAEKVYDGRPWQGGSDLTFSGFVPGEDASVVRGNPQYGGTAQGVRNAGSYMVTVSGLQAANYIITYEPATLIIRPAPLTVQVHDTRKVYDGRPYTCTHGVSYAGFVAGEDPSVLSGTLLYNGNWPAAINAGTYQIVPGGLASGNYAISYRAGSLEITKAPLQVTAENKSKTYDGQPFNAIGFTVRYTGFVAGDNERQLLGSLLFNGSATTAINAGSYAILPGGLSAANYEPHFAAGTLVIDKAPLVVTALEQSKVYDGQPFAPAAFRVGYTGLIPGEQPGVVVGGSLRFTGNGVNAIDAGSYTLLPAGLAAANYDIRYREGLLTIRKADPVLVLPDVVKTYGDADFRLVPPTSKSTGRFRFAVSNDNIALLNGTTVKILRVGASPINVWQDADRNYNAATASARLVVNKAALTVMANATYRCIGDSNPPLSYSIKGFVRGETAAVLDAQPQANTAATAASPAGLYPITLDGGAAANYSFRYVESTLRVNKPQRQPVELPLVSMVRGESAQLIARPSGTDYQWLPAAGVVNPNAAVTEVRVQQDQEFTVRFTESTGCVVVDRVKVRVFEQGGLYVPNAFSPNGDGRNDQLRVIGPGLKLKYFRVFNRFGQMMFETTEAGRGWDGTFKGAPQPEDTYVWVLLAEKKEGGSLAGKGFVIITR